MRALLSLMLALLALPALAAPAVDRLKLPAGFRPADVQPLPDGSLLVSDDLAGAVYRVNYRP